MKKLIIFCSVLFFAVGITFSQAPRMQLGDPSEQYWLWVDEDGNVQKDDDARKIEKEPSFWEDISFELPSLEVSSALEKTSDSVIDPVALPDSKQEDIVSQKKNTVLTKILDQEQKTVNLFTRGQVSQGRNSKKEKASNSKKSNIVFVARQDDVVTFSRKWSGASSVEIVSYREASDGAIDYIHQEKASDSGTKESDDVYFLKKTLLGDSQVLEHRSIIFSQEGKKESVENYSYEYSPEGEVKKIEKVSINVETGIKKREADVYTKNEEAKTILVESVRVNGEQGEAVLTRSESVYGYSDEGIHLSQVVVFEAEAVVKDEEYVEKDSSRTLSKVKYQVVGEGGEGLPAVSSVSIVEKNTSGAVVEDLVINSQYSSSGSLESTTAVLKSKKGVVTTTSQYSLSSEGGVILKSKLYNVNSESPLLFIDTFIYKEDGEVSSVEREVFDRDGEVIKKEEFLYRHLENGDIMEKIHISREKGGEVISSVSTSLNKKSVECFSAKKADNN